ncbi:MAG: substrate-binding domain-containing protein, partial [Proteobacteria bacterium]|nr:substrate-binding domain-containing protein [Pseudomonadota bacterium]
SRNLNLACSHDLVLEDCVQSGLLLNWSIRYMGSLKAIDALCTGKADMAGFHLSKQMAGEAELKALWRNPRYFVKPIMYRELGLVVARGNPLKVRGIEDLVSPEIRFINRQKTAGTRLRLEEILQSKGIDQKSIRGYRKEEFTHSAVALSVAAGAADVAFSLRAAISDLNVDFIPIGRETYCLCGTVELAADARYIQMLKMLSARMKMFPGYTKPSADSKTSNRSTASRLAEISRWVTIRQPTSGEGG